MSANRKDLTAVCVTRYVGQKVYIDGGNLIVTVVNVKGDRAYLRVEAPREVKIDRPSAEQDKTDRIRRPR